MSCCAGNCGCSSACKCTGCKGCGMYPDLTYSEAAGAATETVVLGVAPQKTNFEGSEMAAAASEDGTDGCKCGANCKCDPCNC